ncbi:MAG: glycosyltransferase family 2 protein [Clostridia bacterium]
MISIVVPMWNHADVTQAMLASCTPPPGEPVEVLLIDNGSEDPACAALCTTPPIPDGVSVRVIRNAVNLGFPAAVNQGLAAAQGDLLVIANNDIRFPVTGLADLAAVLRASLGWGAVGPVTPRISGPQQVGIQYPFDAFEAAAALWRQKNPPVVQPVTRLVGFCVMLTREALDKIGGYDPRFSPGNFEDDDWAVRARLGGVRTGVARHVLVDHVGSASHDPASYAHIMAARQQLYIRKWRRPEAAWDLYVPPVYEPVDPDPRGAGQVHAIADLFAPDAGAAAIAAATDGPVTVLVDPVGMPWPGAVDPRLARHVEAFPWPRFRARLTADGASLATVGHALEPVVAASLSAAVAP